MEHTYLKNDPILCTFVIFRRLLMFKKTQKTTQRCIVQSDDAHMFPWVLKNRSLSTQTKPDPVLTQVSRRLINASPRSLITSRLFTLVRLDGKHHAFIRFFFLPPSPDSNDNVRIFSAPPRQCQTRLLRTNRS